MSEIKKRGIHIIVIKGTVRPGNYTSKAVDLVVDELNKHQECSCEVIDPATMKLPFPGETEDSLDAEELREKVSQATGVILSTPEYHGGYSSVIKLVIENLGFPSVLAGKPVALLGVAAGRIHLRHPALCPAAEGQRDPQPGAVHAGSEAGAR